MTGSDIRRAASYVYQMGHWTEETYVESPEVIEESMRRGIERADGDITNLLELLDSRGITPERALDVACGIGRHSIELARRGVAVHGVDISSEYIRKAREHAADAGVSDDTTFEVTDVREIDSIEGTYDLVLHWFAFGYFEDEVNEAVAEHLGERVAPNGALVLGVDNGLAELVDFQDTNASIRGDVLQVERAEYRPESGRMEVIITKFRDSEDGYEFIGEVPWNTRLYSPVEIRRLLERAGFSTVSLYSGLEGTTLQRDSSPLVAVAEP